MNLNIFITRFALLAGGGVLVRNLMYKRQGKTPLSHRVSAPFLPGLSPYVVQNLIGVGLVIGGLIGAGSLIFG